MRRYWWLAVVLPLLLAAPAMAQEQSGSIQGVVKDSQGGVLPGVTVEARSPQVVGVSTVVTDAKGVYRFPALPPGNYEVTANLQGFSPAKSNAALALGQLLRVDLTLTVAGVAETVRGRRVAAHRRQAERVVRDDPEGHDRPDPKGPDFTSVVSTAPGTNNESVRGRHPD